MSGRGDRGSLDLSEQHLVACTNPENSPFNGYGCRGGWTDNVSLSALQIEALRAPAVAACL